MSTWAESDLMRRRQKGGSGERRSRRGASPGQGQRLELLACAGCCGRSYGIRVKGAVAGVPGWRGAGTEAGGLVSRQALRAVLRSDVLSWPWVGWAWHSYTHRCSPVLSLSFIHLQGRAR